MAERMVRKNGFVGSDHESRHPPAALPALAGLPRPDETGGPLHHPRPGPVREAQLPEPHPDSHRRRGALAHGAGRAAVAEGTDRREARGQSAAADRALVGAEPLPDAALRVGEGAVLQPMRAAREDDPREPLGEARGPEPRDARAHARVVRDRYPALAQLRARRGRPALGPPAQSVQGRGGRHVPRRHGRIAGVSRSRIVRRSGRGSRLAEFPASELRAVRDELVHPGSHRARRALQLRSGRGRAPATQRHAPCSRAPRGLIPRRAAGTKRRCAATATITAAWAFARAPRRKSASARSRGWARSTASGSSTWDAASATFSRITSSAALILSIRASTSARRLSRAAISAIPWPAESSPLPTSSSTSPASRTTMWSRAASSDWMPNTSA